MNYNQAIPSSSPARRQPWNKGKLIGAKPPLRASHVWSIRTKLQLEGRIRDLALFNFAIDSKLRGCDVVAGPLDNADPHRFTPYSRSVRHKKKRHPLPFERPPRKPPRLHQHLTDN